MQNLRAIKVVFEDDYLVVVEKPSGLLAVPAPNKESRTLTSILNQQFKNRIQNLHLYPCHRLDQDTSGLIIYAWGKSNQQKLMEEFRARRVKKKYVALVHGKLARAQGTLKSFIEDVPIGGKRFHHQRKLAITQFKLLQERRGYSIVEVMPITGRTNQIRIHFQQMGNSLVGERKYAFARDFPLKFKRVALHATELEFIHPVTGKVISLKSKLPEDLIKFIEEH